MVVDDSLENVRVLHQVLKNEHDVVFALNGEKALEIARTQVPELVLLDAVMPGMDGFAVCAELKTLVETKDIPVIFVTALNGFADEARALNGGAVDFITKPINGVVVQARVRTHLTLKRQSDFLREMTLIDGLSGIPNRRCFDERLEREWQRCERAGLSMALIMADIDHFKSFNDYYGHLEGDACLKTVAATLADCVRHPPDFVARFGGEEFACVLPHESLDGAKVVAQRMLDRVRALAIPHTQSTSAPCVTVSLGGATIMPTRILRPASLVTAADANLYQAKKAGRNRYFTEISPGVNLASVQ